MSSRKKVSRESSVSFGGTQATYETANLKKRKVQQVPTNGETGSQDVKELKRTNTFRKNLMEKSLNGLITVSCPQCTFCKHLLHATVRH